MDLFPGCGNPPELGNGIVLLPHHLLVKDYIEAMYNSLAKQDWKHLVIVSPDHFGYGATSISTPDEREHGFTVHRDYAAEYFPDATVEGFRVQTATSEAEILAFVEQLQTIETAHVPDSTLFIFSIDFSHYLPGGIAHVHDLYSMDVLRARVIDDARKLEVDSPVAAEILLRFLVAKNAVLTNMMNTNPSYDIGVDTFENTTHVFACSRSLASLGLNEAHTRDLTVDMFFAHPRDWYLGRTAEDRYLYGTDSTTFDQDGATDRAVITNRREGTTTEFTFDYFE
ncbi:hypothetical protein IPG41_04370 [Candidatus Peregrinibacteria bacterium]|nr:MAG: hypothetical protein IPG41_04370 [Candidatus Peregrinibacteria bacterium]